MLFLWATPSMIERALATARAWGFEYRTQMIWAKPSIGLGKYVRQKHEILLICRRGDHPAPSPESLPASIIEAPRGEHSAKPEIFHEIIWPTCSKSRWDAVPGYWDDMVEMNSQYYCRALASRRL
jgi:N6-adenosine-specific RNA methylase IME4